MTREHVRPIAWAALLAGLALAWLQGALAAVAATYAALVAPPAGGFAAILGPVVDATRYSLMLAASGALLIFLLWKAPGGNVPYWVTRRLPHRVPSLVAKPVIASMLAAVSYGWLTIAFGFWLSRAAPVVAFPVFVLLHLPIGLAQAPVTLLFVLAQSAGLPEPAAASLSFVWGMGGLCLYVVIEAYGGLPWRRPRRHARGRWD